MSDHDHRLRVRYGETDRMGIAHHGSMVDWFEEARTEWLRHRGASYRDMEDAGVLLSIVDVQVRSRLRGPARRTLARNQGRLGPEAGCRYPERSETYLDNLGRLGLIHTSRDEVGDDDQYEILGVQPAVVQAEAEARDLGGRSRLVKGSVALTAFGAEFVDVCLS